MRGNFERLVTGRGNLRESMGSAVMDDEQYDVRPIVIFDFEDYGSCYGLLWRRQLRIVVESVLPSATNEKYAASQAGCDIASD